MTGEGRYPIAVVSTAPSLLVERPPIREHRVGLGGEQFDSSWDRGEPISFVIARGSLIDGWVDGLVGQPVGSKVLLVVPPESGYSHRAMGPIPAGSPLVFAVDVLEAK